MKTFLVLFLLIALVTASCAGPSKVRWTKPDDHQDQFEKDRQDCIQRVTDDPERKVTVEERLVNKGYKSDSPPAEKEAPRPSLLELILVLPLIVLTGGQALLWGL